MESHSAAGDTSFHAEKNLFRKIAFLLTIPCAIVPIMMATGGMMTAFHAPSLFKYDFLLFIPLYLFYGYGIILSFKLHRSVVPGILFILHLTALIFYALIKPVEWLGYFSVVSIMLTSIINQYFRVGSFECTECDSGSHKD